MELSGGLGEYELADLFGLENLLKSVEITERETQRYYKPRYEHYRTIIDYSLKAPYFMGQLEPLGTVPGNFQAFCRDSYDQAGETFWTVFDLVQKGFYLESNIIYRHLLEVLIQLKYFYKYPELLTGYLSRSQRVTFTKMFNEFTASKLYTDQYGLLSSIAHGTVAAAMFRFESTTGPRRTSIGCEFNQEYSSAIITQLTALLLGYYKHFEVFFPQNTLNNKDLCLFNEAVEWMELHIEDHKRANPGSFNLYDDMEKIIYP